MGVQHVELEPCGVCGEAVHPEAIRGRINEVPFCSGCVVTGRFTEVREAMELVAEEQLRGADRVAAALELVVESTPNAVSGELYQQALDRNSKMANEMATMRSMHLDAASSTLDAVERLTEELDIQGRRADASWRAESRWRALAFVFLGALAIQTIAVGFVVVRAGWGFEQLIALLGAG